MFATSRWTPARCCSIDDTRWRRFAEIVVDLVDLAADRPQLLEHQILDIGVHGVRLDGFRDGTKGL